MGAGLFLGLLGAAALHGAGAPAVAAGSSTRAEVKEHLQGTRQEISELKAQIKEAKRAEKNDHRQMHTLKSQLERLDRELEAARRDQRVHVRNLTLVQDRLRTVQAQMDVLQVEERADREALAQDVVRLYKSRNCSGAVLLLSSRTPAELVARTHYLEELSGATQRRVHSLRDRIERFEGSRREYVEKAQEFKSRQLDAEAARREVEQARLKKQAMLRSVQGRSLADAAARKDLETEAAARQQEVDQLLKTLARRSREQALAARRQRGGKAPRPSSGTTSSLRGRLPWPVAGRVVSRYGRQQHPIFHTTVFNRGIQIAAPYGSMVKAVASGIVLNAGEMDGFGQLVVLDHGGGMMSVYGYGSQVHVQVGQSVEQGDPLEDVGEARDSGQPTLYFEIRQGAKALDPLRFLGRR